MDKDQAEKIIRQACAAFSGTLADHQAIQQALEVVFKPEPPREPAPKGK